MLSPKENRKLKDEKKNNQKEASSSDQPAVAKPPTTSSGDGNECRLEPSLVAHYGGDGRFRDDTKLRKSLPKSPAKPGALVELRSTSAARSMNQVDVLVRTRDVEIVQLLIPAGASIPTYEAAGEIIVQCLKGRIRVRAMGETCELKTSQLVYLSTNEAFSIEALDDASVLATIVATKQGENLELIGDSSRR